MTFKNAIQLLISNFDLIFKYLLYKLIVIVIGFGLTVAFVYPTVQYILESDAFAAIVELDLVEEIFSALMSGESLLDTLDDPEMIEAFSNFTAFLGESTGRFVLCAVAVTLTYIVVHFFDGIGNFTFGVLLDSRMSSGARISFVGAYIKNLGTSALWQVIYVPLTFVFDALILCLCVAFFVILQSFISIRLIATVVSLMLSITLLLAAQAVKLTLFSDAVPAIVSDRLSVGKAFRKTFTFKGEKKFGPLFSTYLVTAVLIMAVNVLGALSTIGAALFITIPLSYLMMNSIQFVSYYRCEKKRYFLSEDTIIYPRKEKTHDNYYDDFEL